MSDSGSATKQLVYELRALGNACYLQGDFGRAEQHYRLALNLYETSFPDMHEEALLCLMGLVQVLEVQGKTSEAQQLESSIPTLNARRRTTTMNDKQVEALAIRPTVYSR
jgi:hypothetical protein